MKNFLIKQILKRELKDLPEADRAKIEKIFDKDPDFLMQLATEIMDRIKNGEDQKTAVETVMKVHEERLRKIIES